MHESKGSNVPLSGTRRFVIDLIHFARQVPSTPVCRQVNVSALFEPRQRHSARPSWALLFMKAYALVGAAHPPLRRALLEFPWPRLYEHPWMNCALAIERSYNNEPGVFVGLFRAPEEQTITQLQEAPSWYKKQPLEEVGVYRRALKFSRVPTPIRRMFWWSTLNLSGYKRAKRFGTFGLTSYGALGAESLHPISPLTTTLTYGPISPAGDVIVKLIYDHRVLDGAYIARRLRDIDATLNGPILEELRAGESNAGLLKPHLAAGAPCTETVDAGD
ncbi:MAG: hypothetical protein P4L84_26325 [Isosphaeraceae bacterium]|nr:hypothetical protein [Isosphaeraceae bacterium]